MPEPRGVELQAIMPVCYEGDSIADTLREWSTELSAQIPCELVVSGDGRRDNTKDVLTAVAKEHPLRLDKTDKRRGYAGAGVTAFRNTRAPFVLAVDSDGQCGPKDFWAFWRRNENDVDFGWRVKRRDFPARKVMSYSFKLLHRILFAVTIHEPICPYVLMRRKPLDRLLPNLGSLTEGFWWEFTARATRVGARIQEQADRSPFPGRRLDGDLHTKSDSPNRTAERLRTHPTLVADAPETLRAGFVSN